MHGSIPELMLVATAVSELIDGEKSTVRFAADVSGSPAPYHRFLEAIEFAKSTGPIFATIRDGRTLYIQGGKENLAIYASQFIFGGHASPGDHHHPELGSPSDYISSDSISVVIEVES